MKIITVCGSMKFADEMQRIAFRLEAKYGYSVLQCVYNAGNDIVTYTDEQRLQEAHLKKIDISDAVYIVDINGYIGEAVKKEIKYARSKGKEIIMHSEFISG